MTKKPTENPTTLMTLEPEPADLSTLGDMEGTKDRPKSLEHSDAGKEDIDSSELKLARLAIAQGLSPQMVRNKPEYISGLSLGTMFNDITDEIYGEGPVTVVPVKRWVTRLEFDPNDKKRVLRRDVPADDDAFKWHDDEPPRATEFQEFACLLLHKGRKPEKVVVSIKTTNKEMRLAATKWTTYVDGLDGAIYSALYKLTTTIISGKNKKGEDTTYGVFIVKPAGFIPKDTPAGAILYQYAKSIHESWKGKDLTDAVDRTDEVAPDAAPVGTVQYDADGNPIPF